MQIPIYSSMWSTSSETHHLETGSHVAQSCLNSLTLKWSSLLPPWMLESQTYTSMSGLVVLCSAGVLTQSSMYDMPGRHSTELTLKTHWYSFKFSLLFLKIIMCMGVVPYVWLCNTLNAVCSGAQAVMWPLGTGVVSCHMGARNQCQDLWKSS